MVNIAFQRKLQSVVSEFDGVISAGYVAEAAGKFYLPLTFDDFSAPDISVSGVTLSNGATKLVGSAGAFDNIRVGDIVASTSTGGITAKSAVTRTVYTVKGQKYVVYADTFNSSTIGVKAGDAVSGDGVAANSVVDRIDYDTRRIFLDKNLTASAVADLDFTPPTRVTAVRKSTATVNPNEVDIDSTVSSAGASSTVVFNNGAKEAVFAVLRLEPVDNETGSKLLINAAVAYLDGKLVQGSANGLNGIDVTALTYIGLTSLSVDGDLFITNARVPSPTTA
jgi:hypothetical protein